MDPSTPPIEYIIMSLKEIIDDTEDLDAYVMDFRKLKENEIAYKTTRGVSQRGARDLTS
jgi:hypothetical protein